MIGFPTLNVPYLSEFTSSRASGIRHLRKWFWSRPAFWIWYIDFSTKIEFWYNVADFFVAWFWQRFEINQMLGWTVPKWIGLQNINPTSGVISVAYPLWDWLYDSHSLVMTRPRKESIVTSILGQVPCNYRENTIFIGKTVFLDVVSQWLPENSPNPLANHI